VEYFGVPAEDLYESGWVQIVHPDDRNGYGILEDRMPRIKAARKCGRKTWVSKNGAVDTPQPHHPCAHGSEDFRTTNGNVLEFERPTGSQVLVQTLVPFIAHDMRHHLASIYCNVEFMSNPDICQTDREQLLTEVRGTVHDMTDLLDSYLVSVRTEKTLHLQPKSMNLLIQRAGRMVRSHPDARHCELVMCKTPSLQARIDSQRLGTAIYNLLLNACQALKRCSPPKRVEISLRHDDRSICIRVQDNGPGVPDWIRNMLFQPFVSAEKVSGIGLGLTIAEQAAREHGGGLNLEESIPGKTVFVLRLPNLVSELPRTEQESEQDSNGRNVTKD
jgi:signal transduction histidine kinase